ncbi:hypothetical protein E5P87_01710 [Helicobacter pylori]|nr:hypothetical protein E5P87_01710 [Helicobacter pylori]
MKMILFNQNPMITKLLESVSNKLELSMENFNRYQELSTRLKEDSEWILIADDECLEKLDQVDWLELKETISQNKNSVCMYKKGNEAQPFLEGFDMKIKKPFLPTEVLKILQKKLGSNMSELEPSQNLDPTQEVLETNWDELENLGDLEALVQEEPNNEEQLLPTLNDQEEKEEVKEEVKETPQEEKPKDDEIQEGETPQDEEVSKELETQEELEIPKEETQEQVKEQEPIKEETQENKEEKQEETQEEVKEETQEQVKEQEPIKEETQENKEEKQEETQEEVKEETQEQVKEQEPIKEETQENKEEKQEKTQDSPSTQELEAMQELVKEIQENSNGQEDKKETQENTETPQELEKQELETPQETPQEKETQESAETPQEKEIQESTETPQEKTQKLETQEDHYESIEDIPEPVMAKAMGEELPFLNESVAKIPNNENDTETPKESAIKTPQEKEESDKTSSPLELRLNLQDLLKSLNQESLKSLLENKTLSIKITLEDKKPDA